MNDNTERQFDDPSYLLNLLIDFQEWMTSKTDKFTPDTITNYSGSLKIIFGYFSNNQFKLTANNWDKFIDYCTEKKYGSSTINGYNAAIKSYGKFIYESYDEINDAPFRNFRRIQDEKPEPAVVLSTDEIKAFLEVLDHKSRNDQLLVKLLYVTNCSGHFKELNKISHKDIDRKNKTIRIGNEELQITKEILNLSELHNLDNHLTVHKNRLEEIPLFPTSREGDFPTFRSLQRRIQNIGEEVEFSTSMNPSIISRFPDMIAKNGLNVLQVTNILGQLPSERIWAIMKNLDKDGINHEFILKFVSPYFQDNQTTNPEQTSVSINQLKVLIPENVIITVLKKLNLEDPVPLTEIPKVIEGLIQEKDEDFFETPDQTEADNSRKRLLQCYTKGEIEKITRSLKNKNQIILYGPPGTSKTFFAKLYAKAYSAAYQIVQFHPSYEYSDFIQGWVPETKGKTVSFERKDKIFLQACKRAKDCQNKGKGDVLLLIDEINRGNLGKIFGELITGLEERDTGPVTLLSGDSLMIPSNLYIIGTMNSADRSVGVIDKALRRRFHFIHFPPKVNILRSVLEEIASKNEIDFQPQKIVDLFSNINKTILKHTDDKNLLLGHSLFISKSIDELSDNLEMTILPMIKENLFRNSEVITQVKEIIKEHFPSIQNNSL